MDIEQLQQLHGNTREDAWNNRTLKLYIGIRHVDIQPDEKQREQQIRREIEQQAHCRAQKHYTAHLIGYGGHEDGKTHRHNDDDRYDEEHGHIVG